MQLSINQHHETQLFLQLLQMRGTLSGSKIDMHKLSEVRSLVLTVHRETKDSWRFLSTEAVQSAALALESIHDVLRSDGLAASVLGVGDGIADDLLQEDL
eukprot:g47790.t1